MKRLGKALVILSLGSLSFKIVITIIWLYQLAWVKVDNVEMMFTLTEGLFNPATQIITALTTCVTIVFILVAISTNDL